jgi:hypothetical protein
VQSNGLLIDVQVGVSAARRAQLWKRGLAVPPPVSATFIIDTGADTTLVNDQIMRTLALTPTDQAKVLTSASVGVPEVYDVFDVALEIVNRKGQPSWVLQPLAVLAKHLPNQGTDGMLGRDVLSLGILEYDGPRAQFKLTY